jgi:hypothetical protein
LRAVVEDVPALAGVPERNLTLAGGSFCLFLEGTEGRVDDALAFLADALSLELPTSTADEVIEATGRVASSAVIHLCPEHVETIQSQTTEEEDTETYLQRTRDDYPVLVDMPDDVLLDAATFICEDLDAGQDPFSLLVRMARFLEAQLPAGHGMSEEEIENMGINVGAYAVTTACPELFELFETSG